MSSLLVIIPLLLVLLLNLPLVALMDSVAFSLAVWFVIFQGVAVFIPASMFWSLPLGSLANDYSRLLTFSSLPVDNLGLVMFLAIAIVGFGALFTARYTITDLKRRFLFTNLTLLALAGMNGVVLANDLFLLYIFLEIVAVVSFVLIAFDREKRAYEGAFKYIVLSAVATVMILASLALLMMTAGGVSFGEVSAAIKTSGSGKPLVLLATGIMVAGLFIKGGLVPFHGWLPDAYSSAPSAVSVLLAGIVTKTAGVYTLIRLSTDVLGLNPVVLAIFLAVGTISIIIGALAALGQSDFKRMLSYSSISQVGYIIFGLGSGNPLGIAGAIFHLFNHSVFKSLLFINAAAVEKETGTRNMDELGGLANKMPVTGFTSVVAFLSTAGIPPLAGFWSKIMIIIGVWQAGHPIYAALAVIASLITLAYFLIMQRKVFFGKLASGFEGLREASLWIVIPSLLLALITIGIGIFAPWLFGSFLLPVRSIL